MTAICRVLVPGLLAVACASAPASQEIECFATRSDTELLDHAMAIAELLELDPAFLRSPAYNVSVVRQECRFMVISDRVGELRAVEPTVLSFDERGWLTTFPQCCGIGHCPELCRATAEPAREGPPNQSNAADETRRFAPSFAADPSGR